MAAAVFAAAPAAVSVAWLGTRQMLSAAAQLEVVQELQVLLEPLNHQQHCYCY
jgi:hypothetical protein